MSMSRGKIQLWLTYFSLITELYTHPCLSVCLCSVSLIFSSKTPFQVSSLFTIVYSYYPQEGVDSTKSSCLASMLLRMQHRFCWILLQCYNSSFPLLQKCSPADLSSATKPMSKVHHRTVT